MEFLVLGPLRVRGAGVPHLPRKPLELLALLLLEPNRPRASDVLADRLWAGVPPPTWESALRVHLSALRAALTSGEEGISRLGRTSSGYVVTAEDHELDSVRFEPGSSPARPPHPPVPAGNSKLVSATDGKCGT